MRQSEFKKNTTQNWENIQKKNHIWNGKRYIFGEGIIDKVKSFFKPTPNTSKPKKPPEKPKKVRFADKKAGDKIVKLLSRDSSKPSRKKMTQQEINNTVLQIMSGGKII